MDEEYGPAALAIYTGALDDLASQLSADPGLVTRRSSCGHPTLLQLVACEATDIVDPVGAARLLVESGAETWYPTVSAAGCNSVAVLEFLIQSGAPFDREDVWTPLEEALYWANNEAVSMLIDHGAQISSLAAAAGLGHIEALDSLLQGDPLHPDAGPIRSPFPDTVPAELANDPTSIIDHAFVMAANTGQLGATRQLLAAGARVNTPPPGYHWKGTALHAAIWRGDRQMVAWLLSIGADPTIRDGLAQSDATGWANHHHYPELVPLFDADTDS